MGLIPDTFDVDDLLKKASRVTGTPYKPVEDVSPLLDRMRGGTSGQESEGDTKAVNPRTGAAGEFQVMPANVGPWTRKYLNRELSVEQFKADPQAQRAVFDGEMGRYLKRAKKRGVDDNTAIRMAAAQWYGGERAINRYDDDWRPTPKEPSFREYTTSVLNRTRRSTPSLDINDLLNRASAITAPQSEDYDDLLKRAAAVTGTAVDDKPIVTPTPTVPGQKPLIAPGQPLAPDPNDVPTQQALIQTAQDEPIDTTRLTRDIGELEKLGAAIQQGVEYGTPQITQRPVGQRPVAQQPVTRNKRYVAEEPVISDVDEPTTNLTQANVTREGLDDAVALTLDYPEGADPVQYVRAELQRRFPEGDFSKFQQLDKGGTGAAITYGALKDAGIDLTGEEVARQRTETPTPDLSLRGAPIFSESSESEADLREKFRKEELAKYTDPTTLDFWLYNLTSSPFTRTADVFSPPTKESIEKTVEERINAMPSAGEGRRATETYNPENDFPLATVPARLGGAAYKGFVVDNFAPFLETGGIAQSAFKRYVLGDKTSEAKDTDLFKSGQVMRQTHEQGLPKGTGGIDEKFARGLGQAAGTIMLMAATGGLGGAARTGATKAATSALDEIAIGASGIADNIAKSTLKTAAGKMLNPQMLRGAVVGVAQQASQAYEMAKSKGATEDQAMLASLLSAPGGFVEGLSESTLVQKLTRIQKLDAISDGLFSKGLMGKAKEIAKTGHSVGVSELWEEMLQGVNSEAAKAVYESRDFKTFSQDVDKSVRDSLLAYPIGFVIGGAGAIGQEIGTREPEAKGSLQDDVSVRDAQDIIAAMGDTVDKIRDGEADWDEITRLAEEGKKLEDNAKTSKIPSQPAQMAKAEVLPDKKAKEKVKEIPPADVESRVSGDVSGDTKVELKPGKNRPADLPESVEWTERDDYIQSVIDSTPKKDLRGTGLNEVVNKAGAEWDAQNQPQTPATDADTQETKAPSPEKGAKVTLKSDKDTLEVKSNLTSPIRSRTRELGLIRPKEIAPPKLESSASGDVSGEVKPLAPEAQAQIKKWERHASNATDANLHKMAATLESRAESSPSRRARLRIIEAELKRRQTTDDREAWQIPKNEFAQGDAQKALEHKAVVRRAVKRGQTVPPEVLADYPDLQTTESKASGTKVEPKEPWQMTPEEWSALSSEDQDALHTDTGGANPSHSNYHQVRVQSALHQGQDVPRNVLDTAKWGTARSYHAKRLLEDYYGGKKYPSASVEWAKDALKDEVEFGVPVIDKIRQAAEAKPAPQTPESKASGETQIPEGKSVISVRIPTDADIQGVIQRIKAQGLRTNKGTTVPYSETKADKDEAINSLGRALFGSMYYDPDRPLFRIRKLHESGAIRPDKWKYKRNLDQETIDAVDGLIARGFTTLRDVWTHFDETTTARDTRKTQETKNEISPAPTKPSRSPALEARKQRAADRKAEREKIAPSKVESSVRGEVSGDIVQRAIKSPITDVGQLSAAEKRALNKAVKDGVLIKQENASFPNPKPMWMANPSTGSFHSAVQGKGGAFFTPENAARYVRQRIAEPRADVQNALIQTFGLSPNEAKNIYDAAFPTRLSKIKAYRRVLENDPDFREDGVITSDLERAGDNIDIDPGDRERIEERARARFVDDTDFQKNKREAEQKKKEMKRREREGQGTMFTGAEALRKVPETPTVEKDATTQEPLRAVPEDVKPKLLDFYQQAFTLPSIEGKNAEQRTILKHLKQKGNALQALVKCIHK